MSTQLSADIACEHSTNNPNPNPNSLPNMPFHPSSGNITLLLWGLGLPPPTVVQVGAANPATWVIDTSRADRGASLTTIHSHGNYLEEWTRDPNQDTQDPFTGF